MGFQDYLEGSTVFVNGSIGDFHNGQSVVVENGTSGTIVEFFEQDGRKMARIHVPESPGQKYLTVDMDHLPQVWTLIPPHMLPPAVQLFSVGDKVEDPAKGCAGFVRAVKSGPSSFNYEIEWVSPKRHEGLYKESVARTFKRIETGWSRLMQTDEY
jgi:hypothetical protein